MSCLSVSAVRFKAPCCGKVEPCLARVAANTHKACPDSEVTEYFDPDFHGRCLLMVVAILWTEMLVYHAGVLSLQFLAVSPRTGRRI